MRIPKQVLWIIAVLFLQQLPGVCEAGVDLPLVFVVLMGVRETVPRAAGWGFLLGLLQDLLSAGWSGPNTVAKTLSGILASLFQRHIYRERVLTQTFLVFITVVFHQSSLWGMLVWDGSAPPAADALRTALRSVVATTLIGAVACFFVVKFRRRRFDPATA